MSLTSDRSLFVYPTVAAAFALAAVWWHSGVAAFFVALLLVLLEVTLSFDNAVVNAKILKDMSPKWQWRFLTWGIALAVVGTRLILPILIVAVVASLSPLIVAQLAASSPEQYAHLLEGAHHSIAAFGSSFLFMVSLKYFFDVNKTIHWIRGVEQRLARWGAIEAIEMALVLAMLFIISFFLPDERGTVLAAGIVGVVLFVAMEGITHTMSSGGKAAAAGGFASFMYLNTLDTAFSLDGVVGAFAITTNLLVIAVGLGVGAYFVRSMTVYLVREGTISALRYLEHGAHWAIFGLAGSMALSLVTEVPEVITAGIGIIFIVASYLSSIRERAAV